MIPITYLKGDATAPIGEGRKIICHVCNDAGGWGAGFTGALSRRWKEPEYLYRQWAKRLNDSVVAFELGAIQFVCVKPDLWIVNMIAQHGYKSKSNPMPLSYVSLRACLSGLCRNIIGQRTVHMPRIGAGLSGGDWAQIEQIIVEELCAHDIAVTVYDLEAVPV